MQRTVTVVSAATAASADVRLDAAAGRVVGDVLDELADLVAAPAGTACARGRPLDPQTPVSDLADGEILVIGATTGAPTGTAQCVVEVVAGPDAGRRIELPRGRHVLGRQQPPLHGRDAAVSRCHVEVDVGECVVVRDLGSVNGTHLDGHGAAAGEALTWAPGVLLRIGDTTLVQGRDPLDPAATTRSADGVTTLHRPPRLAGGETAATIAFPAGPNPVGARTRMPVLASVAPLVAGVVLALVLHRWEFLAFAAMSPIVMLGQAVSDRLAARRERRHAATAYTAATAAARAALTHALDVERRARHCAAPDLARICTAATDRSELLWRRGADDTDLLTLRLGIGSLPATTKAVGGPDPLVVDDVPVVVDLRDTRLLGVAGNPGRVRELARSLVVQAATMCGPSSLRLTVLAPGHAQEWSWARWLPQLRDDAHRATPAAFAATPGQVRARLETPDRRRAPHHLVVVDGVDDPAVADAIVARDDARVIWIASDGARLPGRCDAVVEMASAAGARFVLSRDGVEPVEGVADLLAPDLAEHVARRLAPLRDAQQSTAALPDVVRWSTLHGLTAYDDRRAAAELSQRWSRGPSTRCSLGVTSAGELTVDLRRDGPHVLVAGTTGAGKSELLQTLVASLVAGNSPDDLRLLLVDFKGGTAFGAFTALPHTLDVLTDLDPATTTRALRALTAELRRRERLLADAGATDIDAWRARAASECRRLPRLLIVVDEFATLAEELPDFLGGLVGIAQRGRALGVHLVLATQRPEGAVSADIRANTRLRVCLAVARDTESRDVLDSPVAATISRTTPGRAFVRVAGHELVEMQAARVTLPVAATRPVAVVPWLSWAEPVDEAPSETGRTELDTLVAAARMAADPAPQDETPLWLPPLPSTLALSTLPGGAADGVPLGVVDLPDEQRQDPWLLDDSCEPLLVVGSARSGRTTAALSVVAALSAATPPDELHVYGIDGAHGLSPLRGLPHVGTVVDADDVERVERLLQHLAGLARNRRAHGGPQLPMLLVVDSWETVTAAAGDTGSARVQELVLRLLADGATAGIRVVVTADRAGLMGRLPAAVGNRLVLRLADVGDYAALGIPTREAPRQLPPGRGFRVSDLAAVQVATADDATWAAARAWPAPVTPPRRFEPLPVRVRLHELRHRAADGIVIGVRDDDLAPAVLRPAATGGAFLVAGPPRSGRSTTLVNIAAQLPAGDVVALCARRSSVLRGRLDLASVGDATRCDDVTTAVEAVAAGATLLVDDVDHVDDAAALARLEDAVRFARDGSGFVVLSGTTEAMAAMFRGPVAQARRERAGLLLRPEGPHDGELLGLRLPRRVAHGDPPGRGLLAVDGAVVPVQVPDPT